MKVLMLGWEFPPFFAGGVGMVCYEIAKEVSVHHKDIVVDYIMPYGPRRKCFSNNFDIISANFFEKSFYDLKNVNLIGINSLIHCYDGLADYEEKYNEYVRSQIKKISSKDKSVKELYGKNLLEEVYLYGLRVFEKFKDSNFDLIHAHDWTTIPAALMLKEYTNKPMILHVHITEYDKVGGQPGNPEIMKIEKLGFERADVLIAVSNFTKKRLIENYGVNPDKIVVIHNGGISELIPTLPEEEKKTKEKIVLFTGRVTLQKGVEYFIRAAKKVLEYEKNVKFIVAGTGDLLPSMINLAENLGIRDKIYFHGFYNREEADKLFSMADVFVMPSVSEPFGIVPLEAIAKGTPAIISKQSGVSEVLDNCFKIDFWDIDEMVDDIISLLKYKSLRNYMRKLAYNEYFNLSWEKPVNKIVDVYRKTLENKN